MNPFSALTSKIFAGTSVLALIGCGVLWLTMNAKLSEAHRQANELGTANAILRQNAITLKSNADTLQGGLLVCNQSVTDAAALAKKLSDAGAAAVAQVQQAGKDSTARALRRIDTAPKNTCGDALKILKGA